MDPEVMEIIEEIDKIGISQTLRDIAGDLQNIKNENLSDKDLQVELEGISEVLMLVHCKIKAIENFLGNVNDDEKVAELTRVHDEKFKKASDLHLDAVEFYEFIQTGRNNCIARALKNIEEGTILIYETQQGYNELNNSPEHHTAGRVIIKEPKTQKTI